MALSLLKLDAFETAEAKLEPYTHMLAHSVVAKEDMSRILADYPEIENAGFFPLETLKLHGVFKALIDELQGVELAEVLTRKLGVELRDKPSMVTIRKWSAEKDGRIHNDGQAKIVTALLYLNDSWPENEDGGRFRVLRSQDSFDDAETEVVPSYGSFVTFVRSDNSWHGHKPFVGERKVVQITWLKSYEDLERKEKRGKLAFFLKKLLGVFSTKEA